jgi:urease accessory protein
MTFAPPSRSEAQPVEANRVRATLAVSARHDEGATRLARLREGGGYRIKFPACEDGLDAVIVNVGGGVASGDIVDLAIEASAGARLRVTTQAAEKVYRSAGSAATLRTRARVEAGASLALMPQETILFDGARLAREVSLDLAAGAWALLADMTVFGRLAMGETATRGALRDRWRVRRDGVLIHAEDFCIDAGLDARLDRPACGGGARAMLAAVLIGDDAEALVEPARAALTCLGVFGGASAWDGKLVARALSRDPAALRAAYCDLVALLSQTPLLRCW